MVELIKKVIVLGEPDLIRGAVFKERFQLPLKEQAVISSMATRK